MGFRPNYNQQRNERTRAKERKQQEKLQRREEKRIAARKETEATDAPADGTAPNEAET
jgi:hypothetical protein